MATNRYANNQIANNVVSTENFCMIGTPLPSLDSKKFDPNELKPIWDQEVRDEEGRQRFHGAFTGGFSAGYFNSVGSKEGWKPSTFISSRSSKAKAQSDSKETFSKNAKPEDFMDEEDLEDLKEKRQLKNQEGYQYEGKTSDLILGRIANQVGESFGEEDPLRTLLKSSNKPSQISLGIQVLKRMGWREGHGLGPKVSFERRNKLLKMSGSSQVDLDQKPDFFTDSNSKNVFPPPDTPLFNSAQIKVGENKHGLGWEGDESLESALRRVRNQKVDLRHDDDEDEDDGDGFGINFKVYEKGDDIRSSTLNARFRNHGDEENQEEIRNRFKGNGKRDENNQRNLKENKWRDGMNVMKGFRISLKREGEVVWHEPPPVPTGWTPDPRRVWNQIQDQILVVGSGIQGENLGPEQRANLLGEARIPGPPPSIKDYLSAKSKERLESLTSSNSTSTSTPSVPIQASRPAIIPHLDPSTASSALQGFLPFGNEPSKQARYKAYLQSQVAGSQTSPPPQNPSESIETYEKELNDFKKSALIFRPMSIAMSSRFTSSSSNALDNKGAGGKQGGEGDAELGSLPRTGLYQPVFDKESEIKKEKKKFETLEEIQRREKLEEEEVWNNLSPSQRAAREGRFGDETRNVKDWFPSRLFCKRMDVPDPHPDRVDTSKKRDDDGDQGSSMPTSFGSGGIRSGSSGNGEKDGGSSIKGSRWDETPKLDQLWKSKKKEMENLVKEKSWESNGFTSTTQESSSNGDKNQDIKGKGNDKAGQPMSIENVGLGEDENQGRDTESFVKPDMEIFRAVFGDDDDSDDEDGEQKENIQVKEQKTKDSGNESAQASTPTLTSSTTFKPTFIPKSQRKSTSKDSNFNQSDTFESLEDGNEVPIGVEILESEEKKRKRKDEGNEKKEKKIKGKGKNKEKGKGMLTFDFDDDDGGEESFGLKRKIGPSVSATVGSDLKKNDGASTAEGRKRHKASDLF